jgi:hypothetical protein
LRHPVQQQKNTHNILRCANSASFGILLSAENLKILHRYIGRQALARAHTLHLRVDLPEDGKVEVLVGDEGGAKHHAETGGQDDAHQAAVDEAVQAILPHASAFLFAASSSSSAAAAAAAAAVVEELPHGVQAAAQAARRLGRDGAC